MLKYATNKILLIIIVLFTGVSCNSKKQEIQAEKKDIVESVYASATIKAAQQYNAIAPVSGLLLENFVKEGDSVVAGQIIARIENANPGLNAENARLALELATRNMAGLKELEAQMSSAKSQLILDSINYFRQIALWKKNIGTRSQLELREQAWHVSQNNYSALKTRYRQSKIQLETAAEQARNNYSITSKTNSDFSITSKISGMVYSLNYEPGELVSPQLPIAIVGQSGNFLMEMAVDEADISRIKIGQKVVVSMDAYRGEVFDGIVTKIYPNLDMKTQSFLVESNFVKSPKTLYPGMSAETSIVIREKKNTLVIPIAYLKENNKVVTEDGELTVKTGLKNLEYVEILSGIDSGTKLIRP